MSVANLLFLFYTQTLHTHLYGIVSHGLCPCMCISYTCELPVFHSMSWW